jgi:hypothetical protein
MLERLLDARNLVRIMISEANATRDTNLQLLMEIQEESDFAVE